MLFFDGQGKRVTAILVHGDVYMFTSLQMCREDDDAGIDMAVYCTTISQDGRGRVRMKLLLDMNGKIYD